MNLHAPIIRWLGEVLVFTLLAITLLQQLWDWDIWYHLSIGREVAQTLSVPATEFLVYPNANQSGEFHEWGFGLLFFYAYKLWGYWGMSFLNAAIAGLMLWALFHAVDKKPWSSPAYLLVLLAVFAWMQFRLVYRPEMILYLALACQIFLLERFCGKHDWKWLVPIPLLGFALSQTHPSLIILLSVLGAYALQFAWHCRKQSSDLFKYMLWFCLCGLLTIGLSIVNPYGLEQLLLPLTFSQQEKVTLDVFEFVPALDSDEKWQFIVLAVCAFTALIVQQKRRIVDWLLFLLFSYLAYRFVRNIALFALVMYVPMARGLSELFQNVMRFFESRYPAVGTQQFQRFFWGITIVTLAYITISGVSHRIWGAGPQPGQYPEKTVEVINEIRPPGNIFNIYEMGGYLGWKLAGDYQVFIDGRHYKMNRSLAAYRSIRQARPGWRRALKQYNVNTIAIPPKLSAGELLALFRELINDPEWTLAVAENRELLFFRSDAIADLPEHYRLDKQMVWPLVVKEAMTTISSMPNDHMAFVTLADALLILGDRQQAIKALRDYLMLEPQDAEVAWRLQALEMQN